ncbi:MAG: ABC transporter ATP-binding protein, partial [Spirochaetae bacterium HGW-Spirochaetae-6]
MSQEPLLKAVNLSKTFNVSFKKNRQLFEGLNFSASQGEFICLTGKSGEGKTTLLKILAGILPPSQGQVFFQGKALGWFKNFYRKNSSFIFQDYKLIPHLNIFENVSLPLRIRNCMDWSKRTRDALEFCQISHLTKRYPYQVSGGESQRASIARALSIQPKIIFADEPTGNLDSETEGDILKVFKHIHKTFNITFIVVTHEPNIIAISDR